MLVGFKEVNFEQKYNNKLYNITLSFKITMKMTKFKFTLCH